MSRGDPPSRRHRLWREKVSFNCSIDDEWATISANGPLLSCLGGFQLKIDLPFDGFYGLAISLCIIIGELS